MKRFKLPSFFLIALLSCFVTGDLNGQKLECQLLLGVQIPEAFIENEELFTTSKSLVDPKWGFAQAGLGLRVKIFGGFGFRAEANVRKYNTEITAIGSGIFSDGIISHKKISVAYMPEFRVGKVNTFYVSAGPVVFFEMGGKAKIYSFTATRFTNQERMYGWQASAGIRCQLRKHFYILLEGRHGRTFYQIEDPAFPRIYYKIGSISTGIAFDLIK